MKVFCRNSEQDRERSLISSSPFVLLLLLLMSVPIISVLAPRILPPKKLPRIPDADEADDLALFRRATLASVEVAGGGGGGGASGIRRRGTGAPKIAFLFLTNSNITFAPLWEKFFRGHEQRFNVYVHADPSSADRLHPPTPSFRGRFIKAKATQRASPTLISAARRLLAAALLGDPDNQFFALISQHCVPLHTFRFVYRTLLAGGDIGARRPRYRSFIEILDGEPTLLDRYNARGDEVMLPEVAFNQFRVGSQFFVLTRRHAVMVVRDRRLWKKFKMPCLKSREDSCYPEEHYFPTLLEMQDPEGCTRYTLTRVNWTESVGGHPHTYSPPEISPALIKELRMSNSTYSYMFARKFSPDCLDPLLAIADSAIFRD